MTAGDSRFGRAFIELVSPNREGFYSNDPVDTGGETIWGVSRRAWPKWRGWAIVDAARDRLDFPDRLLTDADLLQAARELYFDEFWSRVHAGRLPEDVGEKVFDIAVNASPRVAGLCLQVALNAIELWVRIDGSIGPSTIAAARSQSPKLVLDALQAAHGGFYLGLLAAKPGQVRFRRGWLRRALEEASALGKIEVA